MMQFTRKRGFFFGTHIIKRRLYYIVQAFFFVVMSGVPVEGYAQKHYDFNAGCQEAYHAITQLRLDVGQRILDQEKRRDPNNLIPFFLENYIDFFELFFNEDPVQFEAKKGRLDNRIQLMSEGPEGSPFNLYTRAVIHFQWAAIKIKFGSNWDAGWEFRRSFLQSKELSKKFPAFEPAAMLSGAMQVVAGTIPDGYKWLSSLLGIKGNIAGGMQLLGGFLRSTEGWATLFRDEAIFYYLYLTFYIQNDHEEVFRFIREHKLDVKNNHLYAYLAANLALNDQQSAMTEQVIRQMNTGADYLDMPIWDLEMGNARLNHLDPEAHVYLERFVGRFKGKFYIKDAWLKLGWSYYLLGDQGKADACMREVIRRGATDADADKQALKDARSGRWPDKLLLKARLLSDGGYYNEALQVLSARQEGDLPREEEKCELTYRMGRIYDGLGRKDEAIAAYAVTFRVGEHLKEYYAARAALQTGYIYEQRGDRVRAAVWYGKCLDCKDHDYKNSLDQKAKAGLLRCGGEGE